MIQAIGLTKSYGEQLLFKPSSFTLSKGERVGLIGRNGSGKSTLFKMILGEESSDGGEIVLPKHYRIGSLKQHLSFSHSTILAECLSVLSESDEHLTYKAEKMLLGLGFKTADFNLSPQSFSGGYQIRLNLAKVLITEPDCLLLDEPTNYLDIVSLRWLGKFLKNFRGEVILITHDRSFMDSVTTHTMGIWRQSIRKIPGTTEKYQQQMLESEEHHEKTRQNSEKKRKELEEFVTRFKAKASKAAQAQSRLKMLEKLPEAEALAVMASLDFEFHHQECPGKIVLEAKNLIFGYGTRKLISDFSFSIAKGDKIAIIGKNGKGKSTLLNLLAKELRPQEGEISTNINTLIGHFGQTNIERLSPEQTIIEEMSSVDASIGLQKVRTVCGTMMFSGELAEKKIKVLSGGEKARVLLGKLLLKPTNLLLLDEPTNHLDQESVEALILELQNYPGAVVFVTHSEGMLRQVASKLIVFQQEKVELLNCNYDEFLTKIGWEEEAGQSIEEVRKSDRPTWQEIKRLRAEIISERAKELGPLKKQMESLEKRIIQLENEQLNLEQQLIDISSNGQSHLFQEKSQRLGLVKKSIEELFEELSTVTIKHDEKNLSFEKRLELLEAQRI